MNILFVSEDHSTLNYGVTAMLSHLADELVRRSPTSRVIIAATGSRSVPQCEQVLVQLIPPTRWAASWRWSPSLMEHLESLIDTYSIELVHIHGVWSAGPWAALKIARRKRIPVVLSVHGMWRKWFWKDDHPLKVLKKRLYFGWILRDSISEDVIIHALTLGEKQDIVHLLPQNTIVVIPNGIDEDVAQSLSVAPQKVILFLGRLHPVKGVHLLIRAFARARLGSAWQLIIAGPEENVAYARLLRQEVLKCGLSDQVKFTGPAHGKTKHDLIGSAWVQVLPSYSEGQSMVNLETAVRGVPSITTYEGGLSDWQEGGGLLVHPEVDALTSALSDACAWDIGQRNSHGLQLRDWVIANYSTDAIMPRWQNVYAEALRRR